MSRKAIHIILPCLLYLFPALLCAQTLTRLEYWFDHNYAKRRNVSLNGSDVTVVRRDRKSTRLNSSHTDSSRMPSSA